MPLALPQHLKGEPLIYHRLTAHAQASRDRVAELCDEGFKLIPFDERRGYEDAIPQGIDVIDLAAGDGGAVFCTPYHPHSGGNVTKIALRTAPGVAFALKDLEGLGCTLRNEDLQWGYHRVTQSRPIRVGLDAVQFGSLDTLDAEVDALRGLIDAFELVRRVGETRFVRQTLRGKLKLSAQPTRVQCRAAAETALDAFIDAWDEPYEDDADSNEKYRAAVSEVTDDIYGVCRDTRAGWDHENWNRELCVWAAVPLSFAVLVFDGHGFDWRVPHSEVSTLGFIAGRAR